MKRDTLVPSDNQMEAIQRHHCWECKGKHTPLVKKTDMGSVSATPTAWVCKNPLCWRYVDINALLTWQRGN